jgi:ABC-type transporter Mla MlaB component
LLDKRDPKPSGPAPIVTERVVSEQQLGAICVTLDGPLTVRGIDAIQARLAAALTRHTIVTVDCAAATEVDLSLIQLLLAARASATHAGKTLRLGGPADGALHASLVSGGFLPDAPDTAPSATSRNNAAFWNNSDMTP